MSGSASRKLAWFVAGIIAAALAGAPVPGLAETKSALAADAWAPSIETRSPTAPSKRKLQRSPAGGAGVVQASRAALNGDQSRTLFELDLSQEVRAEIYTLANPYRVIIDLPDVLFRVPADAGQTSRGLVSQFRYGLFAEHKARIVLDTTGPVRIEKADMQPMVAGKGARLSIAMVPTDAASFGAGTGDPQATDAAASDSSVEEYDIAKPKGRDKPVVIIDPGHGGIDPGAIGTTKLLEKNIALAVAHRLRAVLAQSGRYNVVMTRSTDVFVSLDKRLKVSRAEGADLFVSLHADSIEAGELAQNIRGATVYTLSERASDEQARLMAEKENASDILAGIGTAEGDSGDQVRNILIDLLKRETANFSAEFSNMLAGRLGKTISLSREAQRSASFKVLKQTSCPSVLIELGYMSNAEDERLMTTPQWQSKVAAALAASIDSFFAKRTARAP